MKAAKSVSYFPVDRSEQDLLVRIRESDLRHRVVDLVDMVGQIGDAGLSPADLAQAIQLLVASREGEGLSARFENLEARLKARIESGLAEIEGRLSSRLAFAPPDAPTIEAPPVTPPVQAPTSAPPPSPGNAPTSARRPSGPPVASAGAPRKADPTATAVVPSDANLAFRIGSEVISGVSASQFYIAVWRWLFVNDRVRLTDLPIGTAGKKRFEVAAAPVHPSGSAFYRAEQPIEGVFLEVNLSRSNILRRAKKYLDQYGVTYEVVVGADD
jgi:hypothetical protein